MIFDYPVMITEAELKNETGIDLVEEYGASEVRKFMNELHSTVYANGIYATGDKDIKDRIIQAHFEEASKAIKRALCFQANYMVESGNAATESGIVITADGNKAVVSKQDLQSKVLCIAAVAELKSCTAHLLYAGE